MHEPVGSRDKDDDTDAEPGDVLLIFEVLVGRYESGEALRRCTRQQLAVFQTGPTPMNDRLNFVPAKLPRKLLRERFIEQDAHWQSGSRERFPARRPPARG